MNDTSTSRDMMFYLAFALLAAVSVVFATHSGLEPGPVNASVSNTREADVGSASPSTIGVGTTVEQILQLCNMRNADPRDSVTVNESPSGKTGTIRLAFKPEREASKCWGVFHIERGKVASVERTY